MQNVRSIFNEEQLEMLKGINIYLTDEKDYSLEELDALYTQITDYYQVAAFGKNSEPLPIARDWERIIDTFYDETGV